MTVRELINELLSFEPSDWVTVRTWSSPNIVGKPVVLCWQEYEEGEDDGRE